MNGITAVILAYAGAVKWQYAIVMAVAAVIGGYAGARVGRRMPASFVRAIVVVIGFAVAAYSWSKR
jgi:uncharacterized membrane protein YfcA